MGESMSIRTWRIAAVAVTVTGLLAVGAPAIAAPAHTAPLDTVWTPPKSAVHAGVVKPNPPTSAWSLPTATRKQHVKTSSTSGAASPMLAPTGTTVGAPGLGALPYFSFDQHNLTTDTVARVNLGNGNLLLTSNDGIVHGPSLSIRNDRFYNGLSTDAGSFGGGWSSPLSAYDVGLHVTSTDATYTGANGYTAKFTKSGSTFTAPTGFNASLTGSGPYTLTFNQTGEKLTFNSSGWLTTDKDRNGVGETYSYGSNGEISTVTDSSGRSYSVSWTSTYGFPDSIASITDSAGRETDYGTDSDYQLTSVSSPGGYWETYGYDGSGRINNIQAVGTDPSHVIWVDFTYDSNSRVTAIEQGEDGPSGYDRTTTYGYSSGQTTVTDGNGHTTTYAIDSLGRVTSTTDPLSHTHSQVWKASTDSIASTMDASSPGNSTTYSYDSLNNAVGVSYPTGAAASATYALGTSCTGTGGSAYQVHCTSDAAGNGKKFDYDSSGNLVKITDTTTGGTGAATQQYTYAGSSGCTGSPGAFAGQVCTSKDGDGNTTTYSYDSAGNLTQVTPPSPLGATTYGYDSLGRVTSVTDGNGKTTTYGYNVRDQIVTTTFNNNDVVTTSWYPNGLEAGTSDPARSASTTISYDDLGQQTGQTQTSGTQTITTSYGFDAAGNTTSYGDSLYGTVTYVYDAANELIQLIQPGGSCAGTGSPSGSGCVKFTYDGNGKELTRTLPGNAKVTTTYDKSGRETRVTALDGAAGNRVDIGYSFQKPGTSGTTGDRTAIQTRTSYNEVGIPAAAVTTYGYDSLNRLTSAVEKTSSGTLNASWTYAYDNAGNRTQQVRSGPHTGATTGTQNYTYNAANELTSSSWDTTTWTYDADGNQTQNGITGQDDTYNDREAATAIGSTSFSAMGQGNTDTLARTASSVTSTYDNTPFGLSGEQAGATTTAYDRTPKGDIVGARLSNGTDEYYVLDSSGSVVGIFDGTGVYHGGYAYDPYGRARNTDTDTLVLNNNIRYIGGYYDQTTTTTSNSALYRLGARYYDPTVGRFTQYDPSGQEANPYAYASCNPINGSDPTGTECTPLKLAGYVGAFSGAGAGAGALAGLIIGALPLPIDALTIPAGLTVGTGVGAALGAVSGLSYALNSDCNGQ